MMHHKERDIDSEHKSVILFKFFSQFLPPSGNKRKYAHNEFSYVCNTIQKIFFMYAKIKISEQELLATLSDIGYNLYVSRQKAGNNKKETTTKKNGVNLNSFMSSEISAFIYIGISSKTVLQIRRASNSLSLQKNPFKIKQLLSLQAEIIMFFNSHL
jgi:hypothetical protein